MTDLDDRLTVPDVVELTGRHPETVRRWIRQGDLDAMKIRGRSGHEWLIREQDLLEFLRVEAE